MVRDELSDVVLELTTTEESRLDLVGAGFDAGIHLGEFVERDMQRLTASSSSSSTLNPDADQLLTRRRDHPPSAVDFDRQLANSCSAR
jgi:hypothetical protein